MKKKFSLDFTLNSETERLQAVRAILNELDTTPNAADLELMATYILNGKDENGLNSAQRKETTTTDRRYKSFQRMEDKNLSLNELLENPLIDQMAFQPASTRSIYTKKRRAIRRPKGNDPGDSDIPGMEALWERIDYLEKVLAANEGTMPFEDSYSVLPDYYRTYQLKHMLIDLRRHQYYLKDFYKPEIHFTACVQPKRQFVNWDSDSAYWISRAEWERRMATTYRSSIPKRIEDYEVRQNAQGEEEVKWVVRHQYFDWENPKHIRALMDYYSAIYMELYDELDSWGRTLIYDFDRYVTLCNFSPLRLYILTRKIDKATYSEMIEEVRSIFHVEYNENYLYGILNKEIPNRIVSYATRERLLRETPSSERKTCAACGRSLPRHKLFFGRNMSRKDGFSSKCKECERQLRIEKGGQSAYDRRIKDPTVCKVPTAEGGK